MMNNPSRRSLQFPLSKPEIEALKSEAKKIKKAQGIAHSAALDQVASQYGQMNWKALIAANQHGSESKSPKKLVCVIAGQDLLAAGSISVIAYKAGVFTLRFNPTREEFTIRLSDEPFELTKQTESWSSAIGRLRNPPDIANVDPDRLAQTCYALVCQWIVVNGVQLYGICNGPDAPGESFSLDYEDSTLTDQHIVMHDLLKRRQDLVWNNFWKQCPVAPMVDSWGNTWIHGVYCKVVLPADPSQYAAYYGLIPYGRVCAIQKLYRPVRKDSHFVGEPFYELLGDAVKVARDLKARLVHEQLQEWGLDADSFAKDATAEQQQRIANLKRNGALVLNAWGQNEIPNFEHDQAMLAGQDELFSFGMAMTERFRNRNTSD